MAPHGWLFFQCILFWFDLKCPPTWLQMKALFVTPLHDFIEILHKYIEWHDCAKDDQKLFQNFRDTCSRAHVASHICCCPLMRPHYTLPDHWLQVMVLNTLHLMAPLLIGHLSLSQSHVATEGAYFWGAAAQTQGWAVISCPMSCPAGAGHGSHWGGPEGTLPPAGDSGTGVGCLSGPHLPPPAKVTS